jgi:hypothetical protein
MNYDPNTAIKVNDFRVAIPVKEFARHKGIDVYTQWELINYKYVGSFDPTKDTKPCKGFKTLPDAYEEAVENNNLKEFLSVFYDLAVDDPELCDKKHRQLKHVESEISRYMERLNDAESVIRQLERKADYGIGLTLEERKRLRLNRRRRRDLKYLLDPLYEQRRELRDFLRTRTLSL